MTVLLHPATQRLLTVLMLLFIPLTIIAPHGLVWEVIAIGIIGLYINCKQPLLPLSASIVWILLSLCAWIITTALWAKYPFSSFISGLKTLALMTMGIYTCRFLLSLSNTVKESLLYAFAGGLIIGLLLLLIDHGLGNPWLHFWHKSSAKAFAQVSLMISLAIWPIALWVLHDSHSLLHRLFFMTCLLCAVFYVLFQIDCDTSFVGLGLGIVILTLTLVMPRLTGRVMRFGIPFFIFCFPFLSLYAFKPVYIPVYNNYLPYPTYIDRLYIWNDVAASIIDHPWKGTGIQGTRHHEKAIIEREWTFVEKNGHIQKMRNMRFGIHPHNAILELWLELGIIGFIGGILLAYQILSAIQRAGLGVANQAICNALFIHGFIIAWVNLGLWQSWWISGMWVLAGLTRALLRKEPTFGETHLGKGERI